MLPSPLDRLPAAALTAHPVTRGETLFRREDPTTALYYVQAGEVHLLRFTGQGGAVVIHRALPGESFAEAALFSPAYHCDAVAATDGAVVRIAKPAVLERMRSDPVFAMELTGRFAAQIQNYRRRLEIMAIRDASARVFAAVADGMLTGSIKALAAQIGLSHEATYRALAALTASGRLLKAGRGTYRLP